jgi:hypothetical protein
MDQHLPPSRQLEVETDPRFPSGKWTGFWLQRLMLGRQYMSLNLTFADNRLTGEGTDCVGDFVMDGQYNLANGQCTLFKSYIGAHGVLYEGRNEDDGLWIWGLWHIGNFDQGGFHIWPVGEDDPSGRKLHEQRDLPQKQSRKKLVPAGIGAAVLTGRSMTDVRASTIACKPRL